MTPGIRDAPRHKHHRPQRQSNLYPHPPKTAQGDRCLKCLLIANRLYPAAPRPVSAVTAPTIVFRMPPSLLLPRQPH